MSNQPYIRLALPGDAPSVHAVHTRAVRTLCASAYEAPVIEGWLRGRAAERYLPAIEAGRMWVAERDGAVVGFCEVAPAEIAALFVDPSAAGTGIGRALLAHATAAMQEAPIRLEATLNAVGFYERHGFVPLGSGTIRRNDVDVPIVFMKRRTDN